MPVVEVGFCKFPLPFPPFSLPAFPGFELPSLHIPLWILDLSCPLN